MLITVLFLFVAGLSAAADTGKRAAIEDPLINMFRKQELLLTNIQKELALKSNYLNKRLDSLTDSLARIQMCPSGFFGNTHGCYKFGTTIKMNFNDAKAFCSSSGSHLWEIDSEEEMKAVVGLMKENNTPKTWYYIGGELVNRKWVWARTGTPMTYTKWAPGRPVSSSSYSSLVFSNNPSYHYLTVHDVTPIDKYYVICELM